MATNNSNKRQKRPATRIGKAAVGRTLLILMENLITCYMSAECMRTTMRAVYIYLHSPDILIDECLNIKVFDILKNEIDLSYDRSQKARERAALRKAAREAAAIDSLQASPDATMLQTCSDGDSGHPVEQTLPVNAGCSPTTANPIHAEQTPASANSVNTEHMSASANPDNDETIPSLSTPPDDARHSAARPVKRRRPVRDPDEPAFTYRPPAQKPPKAYVINEDDEVKPYDPYGIREALEKQKVHRLVRSNLW